MKSYLYIIAFCALCLPTAHKAMESKALSTNSKKTYTEKPLTEKYCRTVQEDLNQKWSTIEKKWSTFLQNDQKKLEQETSIFELLFPESLTAVAITPPTPRGVEDNKLVREIRTSIKEKWPLLEKKRLEMLCTQYVRPLESELEELPTLEPEDLASLRYLINLQISLKNPELSFQAKEKMLKKGLLWAITSAGLFTLKQQQVATPFIRSMRPTRNPLALAGTGLSLLDASKKTLATTAGVILVYIGTNKVINSITRWLHSDCEKEKEETIKALTAQFSQELTTLEKKIDRHNREVSRTVEQARENAFKSLLEYDKFEREVFPHIKKCETAQKKTEATFLGTQRDIAKLRKNLYEEIEKVRKHHDNALKSKLSSFKKQIEAVQDKIKSFSKGDQTVSNNEAFAILSQELQRLSENVKQIAPSHSRRSSLAPSEVGTYTSHAPSEQYSRPASPTQSIYSTRSERVVHPRPRPLSGRSTNQQTEDFLKKIAEEHLSDKHSSPEGSEVSGRSIRVMPPTPPKKEAATTDEQASSSYQQPSIITTQEILTATPTPKTPSPHRRRSVCFGIFGKKEPKDTYDPRE